MWPDAPVPALSRTMPPSTVAPMVYNFFFLPLEECFAGLADSVWPDGNFSFVLPSGTGDMDPKGDSAFLTGLLADREVVGSKPSCQKGNRNEWYFKPLALVWLRKPKRFCKARSCLHSASKRTLAISTVYVRVHDRKALALNRKKHQHENNAPVSIRQMLLLISKTVQQLQAYRSRRSRPV